MPWILPETAHVVFDEVVGAALLDERSGHWYHLARPGAVFLKAVLDGLEPKVAASTAAAHLQQPPEQSDQAFLSLFDDLRAAGVLVQRPARVSQRTRRSFCLSRRPRL